MMRISSLLLLLSITLPGFLGAMDFSIVNKRYLYKDDVSAAGMAEMMEKEDPLVVDIRLEEEWKDTGIVPGSIPITFFTKNGLYDIKAFMKELAPLAGSTDRKICRTGTRSIRAANWVTYQGYPNVYNMKPGILKWIKEGRPVVPYPSSDHNRSVP